MKYAASILTFLAGCAFAAYNVSENWTTRILSFVIMAGGISIWAYLQYRKMQK